MVRDLWRKRFTKKVSCEFRVKEWRVDGWRKWRREGWVENWDNHEEMKLVHEVKQEDGSRDEARCRANWKERSVIFREKVVSGRASVTTSEERSFRPFHSLLCRLKLFTLCLKKLPTFKFSVTLWNVNRFSKYLHCWKAYEICYKTYMALPTSP